MTRDEATKILRDMQHSKIGDDWAGNWIDRLTALGILNLDEPKELIDKLANGMTRNGFNPFTRSELRAILEAEGLKLVEK